MSHNTVDHLLQLFPAAPPHEMRLDVAPRRAVRRGIAGPIPQAPADQISKLLRRTRDSYWRLLPILGAQAVGGKWRRDDRNLHRHRLKHLVLDAGPEPQRRGEDGGLLQVRPHIIDEARNRHAGTLPGPDQARRWVATDD